MASIAGAGRDEDVQLVDLALRDFDLLQGRPLRQSSPPRNGAGDHRREVRARIHPGDSARRRPRCLAADDGRTRRRRRRRGFFGAAGEDLDDVAPRRGSRSPGLQPEIARVPLRGLEFQDRDPSDARWTGERMEQLGAAKDRQLSRTAWISRSCWQPVGPSSARVVGGEEVRPRPRGDSGATLARPRVGGASSGWPPPSARWPAYEPGSIGGEGAGKAPGCAPARKSTESRTLTAPCCHLIHSHGRGN